MKRLMTAAVAVTLMCSGAAYAYAQDAGQPAPSGDPSTQGPTASPTQGTDQSGQPPQGQNNAGPGQPNTSPPAGPSTPDQGAAPTGAGAPPPATGGAPDAGAGQVAGNTPDGQPPSNYPACTSRTQDRCVQTGHVASAHTKSHRHAKKPAA